MPHDGAGFGSPGRRSGRPGEFAKLNVDENPGVAELYGISGIPTLVVFSDGEEAGRIVGLMPKDHLLHNLQALLPDRLVEAAAQLAQ